MTHFEDTKYNQDQIDAAMIALWPVVLNHTRDVLEGLIDDVDRGMPPRDAILTALESHDAFIRLLVGPDIPLTRSN